MNICSKTNSVFYRVCPGCLAKAARSLGAGPHFVIAAIAGAIVMLIALRGLIPDGPVASSNHTRFGSGSVVRAGGGLVVAGIGLALVSTTPAIAIAGYGLVGAGVSRIFPLIMSAAARTPGVAHSTPLAYTIAAGCAGVRIKKDGRLLPGRRTQPLRFRRRVGRGG
jgi:hypothetical protein